MNLAACGKAKEGDKAVAARPQEKAPAAHGEIDRSHKGETIPKLVFNRQDGSKLALTEFAGRRVLVNLWATWCAPCLAEMPALDRLAAAEAGKVTVLGVSQDMRGWKKIRPFLAEAKLKTMTVVSDEAGSLSSALHVGGLPMTVLYDENGREVWRVNGPREWDMPGGFRLD